MTYLLVFLAGFLCGSLAMALAVRKRDRRRDAAVQRAAAGLTELEARYVWAGDHYVRRKEPEPEGGKTPLRGGLDP